MNNHSSLRSIKLHNSSIYHTTSSPQLTSNNAYDPLLSHLISKETKIILREGITDGILVSLVRSRQYNIIKELYQLNKLTSDNKNIIVRASCIYNSPSILPLLSDKIRRDHVIECLKNNSVEVFSMFYSLNIDIDKRDVLKYGTRKILDVFPSANKFTEFDFLIIAEYGNIEGFLWLQERISVPSACGLVAVGKVLELICEKGPYHPMLGNRIIDNIGSLDLCIKLHKNSTIPTFNKECLLTATRKGNLKVLRWLHGIGIRVTNKKISSIALKYGHTRILNWLKIMNLPIDSSIKKIDAPRNKELDKTSKWSKSWIL